MADKKAVGLFVFLDKQESPALTVLYVAVGLLVLPLAVAAAPVLLGYWIYRQYKTSTAVVAHENWEKNLALVEEARTLSAPTDDTFVEEVLGRCFEGHEQVPSYEIFCELCGVARAVYVEEGFGAQVPTPPLTQDPLEQARYRDRLASHISKLRDTSAVDTLRATLIDCFAGFAERLPPIALEPLTESSTNDEGGPSQFTIPLIDALPSPGEAIEHLVAPLYSEKMRSRRLCDDLREQLDRNMHAASKLAFTSELRGSPKLVLPSKYDGTPKEIVSRYLENTPFEDVFAAHIPFNIPTQARFEHHWIVAGSGHGKTQTLQFMIANDLPEVANGKASIVVIDSQGDMLREIRNLKVFAPGEPLHGKLCIIDPTDIEWPVALNLFDVGMERINAYSPLDRERLVNGILELYDFVLTSLLSAELTQKQSIVFRYITRLMLHIPNATIQTLRELMEPDGYEKHKAHIGKLQGTARAFFETEFNSKQFEETKRQVVRRLWGILENQTFERMFSHPRNKLDLFTEMNSGKVILINTAKELLKQNGSEIFGRFFIAMIAQAAQERATLPEAKRMPTFVYVDECQDYLDRNVSLILEQARKYRVGLVLAHQYIGQLEPKLQESFAANTSIKFAGGVSDKDARTFAHLLRTSPEFVEKQRKGHFAAYIRNMTDTAVSLRIPFGVLKDAERMTAEEAEVVRDESRRRYAVPYGEVVQSISEQLEETPDLPPVEPEKVETTEVSTKW